jgi:predicted DNA-binding protein with PD1-like motif
MHVHLSASDNTGKTVGGHLVVGCEINTTSEIVIGEANDLVFAREIDDMYGYEELVVKPRI